MADDAGDVVATDATTGAVRWRLNVPGPVATPPVIVGDTVLIAAAEKTLLAVAAADGSSRWLRTFGDQVSAAPTVLDDAVLVPTDDGSRHRPVPRRRHGALVGRPVGPGPHTPGRGRRTGGWWPTSRGP